MKSQCYNQTMDNEGFVYIFINPSMPNYVKIGQTKNIGNRLRDLDTTGVPMQFEPYFTVKTAKYKILEKVIHRELDKLTDTRARSNREFFEISPDKARDLILNISSLLDDAEINDFGNRAAPDALNSDGSIRPISKPTTFGMLGIPVGATLEPLNEKYPPVVTADNKNLVRLEDGSEKTISRAVVDITGTSRNGFSCYKYNGKILSNIRKDIDENYIPGSHK